ncbi:GNAT family N-acetyltransferase [Gracilibacillus caseinilyticus]|uniref:GNAT family N-acetyltransferase n=1 Tax=Gracilibacillus caseinilyticus TaxID=2932256 RepID=A0ABY4F063_9BACI|nr:GNAT family N-acetyltransferase [Gracilibacillus caseinilyticus]UOQ50049.1 GNAT family N-acetyltransferase [Gracilibacillus caseinilyticus]
MEVRQLQYNDAEIYLKIRLEGLQNSPTGFASSYEEEKKQTAEKYQKRFASPETSFTFGAFENTELVGVITLVKEPLFKLRHRSKLVAMYVKPDQRGKGIGKALLLKAIEKAKSIEGLEQIYLTVVDTNAFAKRLYTSIGFEVCGTEKRSLKDGNTYHDAEHMVLFL